MRAGVIGAAAVVAGAGTVAFVVAGQGDASTLPPVGDEPAAAYRVVYEVRADGATTEEERTVVRPFDADVVVRDADGRVLSERASRAGLLATRSQGSDWVVLEIPFAPATSDTRLDLLGADARDTEVMGDDAVGGRRCERHLTRYPGQAVAEVERCVDTAGIVLREVWRADDGETIQTMTAVELETDDVAVGPTPTGTALSPSEGGGTVEPVGADEPVPFAQTFALDPGDGWEFVGRHLVVPPVLDATSDGAPVVPDTALVSDVWRRGPSLLVLDQGATQGGPPPFEPQTGTPIETVAGVGRLLVDDRLAAVNVLLDDFGFVRLSGTLSPDELRALADELAPTGGDR